MESQLVRGDCPICRQRRVLGVDLRQGGGGGGCGAAGAAAATFRCCACLDEYGRSARPSKHAAGCPAGAGIAAREGPLVAPAAAAGAADGGVGASNWWASEEPPARLRDVSEGLLQRTEVSLQGGGHTEDLVAITDPEHNFFSGHGAERVWPASLALARHLMERFGGGRAVGLKAVELGAGTGLPSLVLARLGCAAAVLTDVTWVVQLLEYNVQANFAEHSHCRPRSLPLRWGSSSDIGVVLENLGGTPDLVIAADVVYRLEDLEALMGTLAALGGREVVMSVVNRGGSVVSDFLARLAARGWKVEASVVSLDGCPTQSTVAMLKLRAAVACREALLLRILVPSVQTRQPCPGVGGGLVVAAPGAKRSRPRTGRLGGAGRGFAKAFANMGLQDPTADRTRTSTVAAGAGA